MPEFDFSGSFVNVDNVDDGDICVIVDMPVPEEKESAQQKEIVNGALRAKKYWVLNMPVEISGLRKTYTPDPKTGVKFQKAWGKDYAKWVGQQFTVLIESYTAFGVAKQRVAGNPMVEKI